MTHPVIERPLADYEMEALLDGVSSAATPGEALVCAVFGVFDVLLNDVGESTEDYTTEKKLDGTRLRIPKQQWTAIGQALVDKEDQVGRGDVAKANILLDWMNVGPSSF